jgi:hypothetical protein
MRTFVNAPSAWRSPCPHHATLPTSPTRSRLSSNRCSAVPKSAVDRRLGLGLRGHSLHPRRPQRLRPRLRGGRPLRSPNARRAARGLRGRWLRAAGAGRELGRAWGVPLRDEVRDGVGPHGQHPRRLHPVHGGEPQRAPLGDCVHKRADHPDRGRSGGLRGAQARGGSGRVRGARGKGIGE